MWFPNEGSLICPPGDSMIFDKKETGENELVATPDRRHNEEVADDSQEAETHLKDHQDHTLGAHVHLSSAKKQTRKR